MMIWKAAFCILLPYVTSLYKAEYGEKLPMEPAGFRVYLQMF